MGSLEVPYQLTVADGINIGWCLTVRGTIAENPNCFTINLRTGDGSIALHVNPRFNDGGDAGPVVVLNSLLGDSWGAEERPGDFPFTPSQDFEVKVRSNEDAFSVEANDAVPLCNFAHRVAASSVTTVDIYGDISLSAVEVS